MAKIARGATGARSVREVQYLAGVGGAILFLWRAETANIQSRIEIEEWAIDHRYINARLPMTGGLGSIQYRRVADTFDFAVIAVMDLRTTRAQQPGPGSSAQPFYDGRMEGNPSDDFLIKMEFQCGDPDFLRNPNSQPIPEPTIQPGVHLTCDEVILETVRLVNSARGDDVLRYLIKGHGSKPLQRWAGRTWTGGGAFGISQPLQGQVP